MSIPTIPIKTPENVINSYVYLNESDVIYSSFETDRLITITAYNVGLNSEPSSCALTANISGPNSGYFNIIRNEMLHQNKIDSLSSFTSNNIGFLIFNKKYIDSKIIQGSLTATATGSFVGDFYDSGSGNLIEEKTGNIVGNVFNDLGMITLTSDGYEEVARSITGVSYKPSVFNFNISVYCKCQPDQLNFSYNNTAFKLENNDYSYTESSLTSNTSNAIYLDDLVASGVAWQPAITSLGLYDEDNNLLAIAKISKPIRKSTDIPMTFAFSIDI